MAITYKPTKDRSGSCDSKYKFDGDDVFYGLSDNKNDDQFTALAASPYSIGDNHPTKTNLVCINLHADCIDEDGKGWKLSIQWGAREPDPENPLDKPIEFSGGFASGPEQPLNKDAKGKPVINTVGDLFLETVTRETKRFGFTVKRNEESIPLWAAPYVDALNRDNYQGFPPGTVHLVNVPFTRQWSQEFEFYYYEVAYEFEVDFRGFKKKVFNAGLFEKKAGVRVRAKDKNLNDETEPVALDEAGARIPFGSPPVSLEFDALNELPFSDAFDF